MSWLLSIATSFQRRWEKPKGRTDGEHFVEGELSTIRNSGNDLFHLATQLAESGRQQPKLFQCCGTEDFLYEENVRFRNHCRQLLRAIV